MDIVSSLRFISDGTGGEPNMFRPATQDHTSVCINSALSANVFINSPAKQYSTCDLGKTLGGFRIRIQRAARKEQTQGFAKD